jgi:hypothetical protein
MNTESLHFKIGLSGSSIDKNPEFNILVNDTQCVFGKLSQTNQTEYFEFNFEVNEGNHNLVIEFLNKTEYDTVLDSNGNIIKDLLLNIDSIEIDDIDLGSLCWTGSDYRPIYPNRYRNNILKEGKQLPESVKNCVHLGWNGRWILPFQSPFYHWLLENI